MPATLIPDSQKPASAMLPLKVGGGMVTGIDACTGAKVNACARPGMSRKLISTAKQVLKTTWERFRMRSGCMCSGLSGVSCDTEIVRQENQQQQIMEDKRLSPISRVSFYGSRYPLLYDTASADLSPLQPRLQPRTRNAAIAD